VIIDVHGHTVAPPEMYEYQAKLYARRSAFKGPKLSDDQLQSKLAGHLNLLDSGQIDVQFISPRPYTMGHSLFGPDVVGAWTLYVNDVIRRQCDLQPERFRGIAGLPQFRVTDLAPAVKELERAVSELGFVGCLLNPDPCEGDGETVPGLGDRYWYPLYEKLCELDVPAMIHSASCTSPRESYSLHFINEESIAIFGLLNSQVLQDFPELKIVVAHGGGAIPYQLGRFRASGLKSGKEDFADRLRKLNFDTVLYSPEGLELLFKVVGAGNCLFGTERPGTGAAVDPRTGQSLDDLKPLIDQLEILSDDERRQIYETNARRLYPRAFMTGR
jgi:4-oxalmesaconate hydratase